MTIADLSTKEREDLLKEAAGAIKLSGLFKTLSDDEKMVALDEAYDMLFEQRYGTA